MEASSPVNYIQLNNNICQDCGLPLKIYSYEITNQNNEEESIKLQLFCQNLSHKKISQIDFEDYQSLLNNKLNNICKCFFCNQFLGINSQIPYYCYDCQKIICINCINDKHQKEHKNILNYYNLQNYLHL